MARFEKTVGREMRLGATAVTTILFATVAGALPQKAKVAPTPPPSETTTLTIDLTPRNQLVFPSGIQSFEKRDNIHVGESATVLPGWGLSGAGVLSAFVAESPTGLARPGSKSKRWLCVEDVGATSSVGLTSPEIHAPAPWNYNWQFALQVQAAPVVGTDLPVLAIQHPVGGAFEDAFGVRLTPAGAEFFVTGLFGSETVAPLFDFMGDTDIGSWVTVKVVNSLAKDTLRVSVNGTEVAMVRTRAASSTDLTSVRFAYHGSGAGNLATVMLDDLGIAFTSGVCEDDVTIDFDTEDDFATALVNGQDITTPPEFGVIMAVSGSGPNRGAAIFDSNDPGPNNPSQDLDLLVNQGNILILQNDDASNPAAVAGVYPRPNDDEDGGTLTFDFLRPLQALSVDLIDIDNTSGESALITLTDYSALTRVFTVPADWTGNVGVGTLDLQSLLPQAGFNSVATAVEDGGFDPNAIVSMDIELGSSGGVDNLHLIVPCVQLTFEVEDDGTPVSGGTPLVNGQDLSTPPEFGIEVAISDAGPNAGAAIFDSTNPGPNNPGPDLDLLVGLGNILIVQNDAGIFPTQTSAGFFDIPNDDTQGGDLIFDFPGPVECRRIDLIDIDEEEDEGATVTLLDVGGKTRTFTCPIGWTEDRLNDGPPAFRTLDLTTLANQGGFMATATAVEDPGFDQGAVVKMTVHFGGAQAMDNFCFCPGAPASF